MNNEHNKLIYVWDAYCGWCYGFSQSLRSFYANHPELSIEILSGGLFIGDRKQPISSYPHIPEANNRISQLTGVEFGDDYNSLLTKGDFLLDSEAAAIGFSALRSLAPERVLDFSSAMQKAFYLHGKSLSDPATYSEIAVAYNLDPHLVIERMNSKEYLADAHADFTKVYQHNIHSYPTLLLQKGKEYFSLGGGAMTAEKLEARLKEILEK